MKGWILTLFLLPASLPGQLVHFNEVNFTRADSVARFYGDEDLGDLPALSQKLTYALPSQLEKFRAIYTWVCQNIETDYGAYLKNKKKRENLRNKPEELARWNHYYVKEVFRKLLKEQKTVCTGYAFLVKQLAEFSGINCEVVDGYARTYDANIHQLGIPNHSWNAVQLNGEWYLCDPSWSSGTIYSMWGTTKFVHEYNQGYFLTKAAFFIKNHYPLDPSWQLVADTDLEDFLEGPLVYSAAFRYGLNPKAPSRMEIDLVKRDTVLFSLETPADFNPNQLYFEMVDGARSWTIEPKVVHFENNLLTLACVFYQSGLYDLHVKIENDFLITYTLNIRKR